MLAFPDATASIKPRSILDETSRTAQAVDEVQTSSPSRRLLTAEQVAVWLAIPKPSVYRLVREHKLVCVSIGRFQRFDPAVIGQFIATGGVGLGTD